MRRAAALGRPPVRARLRAGALALAGLESLAIACAPGSRLDVASTSSAPAASSASTSSTPPSPPRAAPAPSPPRSGPSSSPPEPASAPSAAPSPTPPLGAVAPVDADADADADAPPTSVTATPGGGAPPVAPPVAASAPRARPLSTEAQAPGTRYAVAAIGDSLTDPKSHGGKYLSLLAQRCPRSRFDNFGKGGQMVNQMRRRFARDILGDAAAPGAPRYTHVLVFGGINDIHSDQTAGRRPAMIERDLGAIYAMAREHGLRVVAFTLSPWGDFSRYFNPERQRATLAVNAWIRAQRPAGHVDHVIDAYALLSCGDAERLCPRFLTPFGDGLHFGKEAHALLADALHREVFADCR